MAQFNTAKINGSAKFTGNIYGNYIGSAASAKIAEYTNALPALKVAGAKNAAAADYSPTASAANSINSHTLASHTNFTSYFNNTSALTALTAGSASKVSSGKTIDIGAVLDYAKTAYTANAPLNAATLTAHTIQSAITAASNSSIISAASVNSLKSLYNTISNTYSSYATPEDLTYTPLSHDFTNFSGEARVSNEAGICYGPLASAVFLSTATTPKVTKTFSKSELNECACWWICSNPGNDAYVNINYSMLTDLKNYQFFFVGSDANKFLTFKNDLSTSITLYLNNGTTSLNAGASYNIYRQFKIEEGTKYRYVVHELNFGITSAKRTVYVHGDTWNKRRAFV